VNERTAVIDDKASWRLALFLALAAFFIVLLRTAHIVDDAYISFRSVYNLVSGYGLTWNVSERVQAFTNPLWVLLLAAFQALTHEIYYTSLAVSVALSMAAVWLLATRIAATPLSAVLAVAALLLSKSFVDYSTSGMENPLTHFLLVVFLVIFFSREVHTPRTIFLASLTTALLMVNRMDCVLLVAPALAWMLLRAFSLKALGAALLGGLPFIAWELFSLIYYGFPFPNTAYAKLNTHVWAVALMAEGLDYLRESLDQDPITLALVLVSGLLAVASRSGRAISVALGVALYLVYLIKVGGDFMGGRLISAPFLASVALLARFPLAWPRDRVAVLGAVAFLAFALASTPRLTTFSGSDYGSKQYASAYSGMDMRAIYYHRSGLLKVRPLVTEGRPNPVFLDPSTKAVAGSLDGERTPLLHGAMGYLGFHVGPPGYVVDIYALTDPFLSRLPAITSKWKPGHYLRKLPVGYAESLRSGENRIRSPGLARLYDAVRLVVTGPLLDPERWRAIWDLNSGAYRAWLPEDPRLGDEVTRLTLADLSGERADGAPYYEAAQFFSTSEVEIGLGQVRNPAAIDLSLGTGADYRLELLRGDRMVQKYDIERGEGSEAGALARHVLPVPEGVSAGGIDGLRLRVTKPYEGSYHYAFGHLVLE
jgi:arabinofuranosyltransferase